MIAKERLYVTEDRRTVVKEGDKKAAFLLVGKGQEIPDVIARQYGLIDDKKKQAKKAENKMFKKPENKAEAKEE